MRKAFTLASPAILLLSACATEPLPPYQVEQSYLQNKTTQPATAEPSEPGSELVADKPAIRYQKVPAMKSGSTSTAKAPDLPARFSNTDMVSLSADALPMNQFLHYVFGEVLAVSYILDAQAKNDSNGLTLNIQEPISKRKLFTLVDELLISGGYQLALRDGIYYISGAASAGGNTVVGYGREVKDIPQTSLEILQIVPLKYPVKPGINMTIEKLAKVKAMPDYEQNMLTISGRRADIVRAIEFIELIDTPAFRDRNISLYQATFVGSEDLADELIGILANEGITASKDKPNSALSLLPIPRLSAVLMFANDPLLLERSGFWLKKLDQPAKTAKIQYFTYNPRYARASDIAESLAPLIGGAVGGLPPTSGEGNRGDTNATTVGKPNLSAGNDKLKMVVDARSNALIIESSGEEYQKLLPLIKRMDVMPKQVMLEVMIAEVTLKDEFKMGVEFALQSGDLTIGTKGAFMGEGFGGLSAALKGVDGEVLANFFQSNSLVNVLSRPSLVVRDGVNASINVGTDLPTAGETTSVPGEDKETTSVVYRKTGVELTVTPTINAQGVVIMEIEQNISNQVEVSGVFAQSPGIFERRVSTEVVADSGQTVILGGLMSENKSVSETKVPLLGDIPWLGQLFRGNTDTVDKTELIIMVTPRVIESSSEWQDIKHSLDSQYSNIKIQ